MMIVHKNASLRPNDDSAAYSNTLPPPTLEFVLDRIKKAIASSQYPSISDVEQVMDSTRLAGRKEVLIYILVKCFQIRGKCVSEIKVSSNGIISVDSSTLEFATKVRSVILELSSNINFRKLVPKIQVHRHLV